jgi:uncharacterized protein (TIGR02145 family)
MKYKMTILILLAILFSIIPASAELTQTQVSELYVTIFGRASEGEGNTYWQNQPDMVSAAEAMLGTRAAKDYFGTSLDTNQAFIEHIYANTLNKTILQDAEGIHYWTAQLNDGVSRCQVVASLIEAVKYYAPGSPYYKNTDSGSGGREGGGSQTPNDHQFTLAAYYRFQNRVTVSSYMAETVDLLPVDWQTTTSFDPNGLNVTDQTSTVISAKVLIDNFSFTPVELGKTEITLQSEQSESVTVSGGTGFYTTAVSSDGNIAAATLGTGHTVIIVGISPGAATITVTDSGDGSADITVNVADPVVPPLELDSTNLTLESGESETVTVSGGTGFYVTAASSDGNIVSATLGANNTITIVGVSPGAATVTVTDSADSSVEMTVTISDPVVVCGAYVAPDVWKEFDCYNLAAIGRTTNDDPFTPGWRLIGGYWQWGRTGPDPGLWYITNTEHFAHGPTGPKDSEANSGNVPGWDSGYASNSAWSDSFKTAYDPCPVGFRMPTKTQWDGVIINNIHFIQGSWTNSATNYSTALNLGNNLMLPTAGFRSSALYFGNDFSSQTDGFSYSLSGALQARGEKGYYWSSSKDTDSDAWALQFTQTAVETVNENRRNGYSVRCISE